MADKYVNPDTGTDDAAAGRGDTFGDPYKTIAYAYPRVADGDSVFLMDGTYDDTTQGAAWTLLINRTNTDVTIEPYSGNVSPIVLAPTGGKYFNIFGDGSDIQINDITVNYLGNGQAFDDLLLFNADADQSVTFNNCTLDTAGSTAEINFAMLCSADTGVPKGTLILNNTTLTVDRTGIAIDGLDVFKLLNGSSVITTSEDVDNYGIRFRKGNAADGTGVNLLQLRDSAVTAGATGIGVGVVPRALTAAVTNKDAGTVDVRNCTITGGDSALDLSVDSIDKVIAYNNTLTSTDAATSPVCFVGLEPTGFPQWATATAYDLGDRKLNDAIIYRCTQTHADSTGLEPGTDQAAEHYWTPVVGPEADIELNTITCTEPKAGHGIFFGYGVTGGLAESNKVSNCDRQAVIKGIGCLIKNNLLIGDETLILSAGSGHSIINNTCVSGALGNGGAYNISSQGSIFTKRNICYNNIFVITAGPAMTDRENPGDGEESVDYNCYYRTDVGDLFYLGGASRADLTALKTQWNVQNPVYGDINDTHSLNVNPQLDSNYKPTVSLPGKPDINGDNTSMGAIGVTAGGKGRYSGGGRYS